MGPNSNKNSSQNSCGIFKNCELLPFTHSNGPTFTTSTNDPKFVPGNISVIPTIAMDKKWADSGAVSSTNDPTNELDFLAVESVGLQQLAAQYNIKGAVLLI